MFIQPSLALTGGAAAPSPLAASRTGTFIDNMKLPVHRWFRYSAGFSAEWAAATIAERRLETDAWVLDPFAGSGTTLLAAQDAGVPSVGVEAHGFVARIAAAKLLRGTDPAMFREAGEHLLAVARLNVGQPTVPAALLTRCYAPDALQRLLALREAWRSGPEDRLTWLAITAILRECSGVGTAQWQYLLPNKSKATVRDPFEAFAARVEMMATDMSQGSRPPARIVAGDAREVGEIKDLRGRVGLVITSPPYPNNFDYSDATRLEMTFWDEVGSWSDLHRTVRHKLITSCSQHSAAERLELDALLMESGIAPIRGELETVCRELEVVRETRGGRKTYHTMVAAYFRDLAQVWRSLRSVCMSQSEVCFVIGDSAPYGVHVPVERWMSTLAEAAGFSAPSFRKLRDRNTKWKNRKHRVPLHEGELWLKG